MKGWNETSLRGWAFVPIRLIVGFGFLVHGAAKLQRGPEAFGTLLQQIGVPLPTATAWVVTLAEVFGGIAILVGAFVALASIPLIATMLVAMFAVHLRHGFSSVNTIGLSDSGPLYGPPGYEINLLYIAGLLGLVVGGAGRFSVDRWRARRGSR